MVVTITHGVPGVVQDGNGFQKTMQDLRYITCVNSCCVEARAAGWHRGGKVDVGEAQGAEDGLGGESGEEADDDQGREKDQGGGQHGGFEQGLTELFCIVIPNSGGEEREGK